MANRLLTTEDVIRLVQRHLVLRQIPLPFDQIAIRTGSGLPRLFVGYNVSVELCTADLMLLEPEFENRIITRLLDKLSGEMARDQRAVRPEEIRGATHGDFTHMSITIQKIKDAMGSGEAWSQCSATQRESLELIATKIGRIVCGDPNHVDHWDDIIGYAALARNRIARKHA